MKILVKLLCIVAFSASVASAETGEDLGLYDYGLNSGTGAKKFQGLNFKLPVDSWGLEGLGLVGGDCHKGNSNPEPEVRGLAFSVNKSTEFYSCSKARNNLDDRKSARFSKDACQNAVICRNSLGNNENARLEQADIILNEIVAKDYVKNVIIVKGDDMEQLELLRQFAQKKFNKKISSQCSGRFQQGEARKQCKMSLVEEAFEEYQNECTFGFGCYKNDDSSLGLDSYKKFKSKNKDKDGKFISEYYKYRIDTATGKNVSDDEKRIADLSAVITSSSFKSLKTEQKIESFLKIMGKDANGRLKDPVLSYDLGSDLNPANLKKSEKFKDILKMLESKDITKENFAKDFDSFRKNRVEAIFGNDDLCKKTGSLIKICVEATKIANGNLIKKGEMEVEHLSSRDTQNDSNSELLKRFLGQSFEDKNFEVMVNAKRCISYGFTDVSGNPYPDGFSVVTAGRGAAEDEDSDQSTVGSHNASKPSADDVENNGADKGIIEAISSRSTSETSSAPKSDDTSIVSENNTEKLEEYRNGIGQTPQHIGNNYTDMFNNNFDAFSSKAKEKINVESDKAEEAQSDSISSINSQDKMNEYLMKKLATAEENLEKMKAESEAAEADRAKQKKMDEEAALIKDLKGQIAELKVQATKNSSSNKVSPVSSDDESRSFTTNNRSNSFSSGGSIISSRGDAAISKPAAESFDSSSNPSGYSDAPVSASRSIASSGTILTSVSNADGSRTTTLASGIVLTTVDGMSSEKAAQTISNRILELNGTPFYIEEGGMVKEIIAVVKDGKVLLDEKGNPIFEKIVKGKVGDKKFAAQIKDKKDRAPAAITDAADLKRDQEEKLKRQRAEYLKLKKLTSEALKKK